MPFTTKYYKPGRYYGHLPGTSLSSATMSLISRAYLVPFYVTKTTTFDRIGISVSTGQADTIVRLGIYNTSSTTFEPTTVVLDAGTVDTSSSGTKEITISQSLDAGLYCLAAVRQGTGSTAPTVSFQASNTQSSFFGGSTTDARNGAFLVDGITGALTTISSSPSTFSIAIVIFVRAE
jgi:hypothetical protein